MQLVEPVLKAHGIGVFPIKQTLTVVVAVGLLWMFYSYLTSQPQIVTQIIPPSNPYQPFYAALTTPAPDIEMKQFIDKLQLFYTLPGWTANSVTYSGGTLTVAVTSQGGRMEDLELWASKNAAQTTIETSGMTVKLSFSTHNRPSPSKIYNLQEIISRYIDTLAVVYPGNNLSLGNFENRNNAYKTVTLTLKVSKVSPAILRLISETFNDLPFSLQNVVLSINNGNLSGSISLIALGR